MFATSGVIQVNPIVVLYTSGELDRYMKTSATARSSRPETPVSSATTMSASSGQSTTGSSHLSTGAKAGIGVGAALGGILLLLAIGFGILFWRRRAVQGETAVHTPQYEKAELPGQRTEPQELSAVNNVSGELPGSAAGMREIG